MTACCMQRKDADADGQAAEEKKRISSDNTSWWHIHNPAFYTKTS